MKRPYRTRRELPLRGAWRTVVLIVFFALAAVAAALLEPAPADLAGRASVADGDTLRLGGERVRLLGLDAPELDQTCTDEAGKTWRCGRESSRRLSELIGGETVHCESRSKDRYGRHLGRCSVGGSDLGAVLVAEGLAVADLPAYAIEEAAARSTKRGVWAGPFDTPRRWRDTHGDVTAGFDFLGWIRSWFG